MRLIVVETRSGIHKSVSRVHSNNAYNESISQGDVFRPQLDTSSKLFFSRFLNGTKQCNVKFRIYTLNYLANLMYVIKMASRVPIFVIALNDGFRTFVSLIEYASRKWAKRFRVDARKTQSTPGAFYLCFPLICLRGESTTAAQGYRYDAYPSMSGSWLLTECDFLSSISDSSFFAHS